MQMSEPTISELKTLLFDLESRVTELEKTRNTKKENQERDNIYSGLTPHQAEIIKIITDNEIDINNIKPLPIAPYSTGYLKEQYDLNTSSRSALKLLRELKIINNYFVSARDANGNVGASSVSTGKVEIPEYVKNFFNNSINIQPTKQETVRF